MPLEIERKFRVDVLKWQAIQSVLTPKMIRQGYLSNSKHSNIRIRTKGLKAFLTIKSTEKGISRSEFEYEIPFDDAAALLNMCPDAIIQKKRYEYVHEGHCWEIDVFEGANAGLIVAEIELADEQQTFIKPDFILEEVSFDLKYRNVALTKFPFSEWT